MQSVGHLCVFAGNCCREHLRHLDNGTVFCYGGRVLEVQYASAKLPAETLARTFFSVFASEYGRLAFYDPASHGFLVAAFLKALQGCGSQRCSLHYALEDICIRMRPGQGISDARQKPCIYSTAYGLAKNILFLDPTLPDSVPAPTLLVRMSRARLMQWTAVEMDIFRKHRAASSLRRRQQLVRHSALSTDVRALMLLRDVAVEKTHGKPRYLKTTEFFNSIRRHGVRPRNIPTVVCMINIIHAKYLSR